MAWERQHSILQDTRMLYEVTYENGRQAKNCFSHHMAEVKDLKAMIPPFFLCIRPPKTYLSVPRGNLFT